MLRVTGLELAAELPYAALHLLLRPSFAAIDTLPGPQADATLGAFGMAAHVAGDRFLVGLATLELIAELSPDRPLVCLVDDAQWLNRESVDALLFAVRRLYAEQMAVLFAARNEDNTFAATGMPTLRLAGLDPGGCRTARGGVGSRSGVGSAGPDRRRARGKSAGAHRVVSGTDRSLARGFADPARGVADRRRVAERAGSGGVRRAYPRIAGGVALGGVGGGSGLRR